MPINKLDTYAKVGVLDEKIISNIDFYIVGTVYAAPGVIKHIKKNHGSELDASILSNLVDTIKSIISAPDYVGQHPNKNGIEFVKKISDNLQLGIEVDDKDGYLYVATLHPIKDAKIEKRLKSGRLKKL